MYRLIPQRFRYTKMKILFSFLAVLLAVSSSLAQDGSFKRKFVNHTEFGGLFGRVKYGENPGYAYSNSRVENRTSLTIQTFNGISLTPRLDVGVTLGFDWYKTALLNPIAAGVRFDLTKGEKSRLFLIADAGYAFNWLNQDSDGFKTKGGWMVNPGLGVRIGKINTSTFTLSLTYKRQEAYADKPLMYNQTVRYEDRVYNRIAARVGISF